MMALQGLTVRRDVKKRCNGPRGRDSKGLRVGGGASLLASREQKIERGGIITFTLHVLTHPNFHSSLPYRPCTFIFTGASHLAYCDIALSAHVQLIN